MSRAANTYAVSDEWLLAKQQGALRSRRISIVGWLWGCLISAFVFLQPYLGLPPNPTFMHGHGRAFQIIVGISLTIFTTVWNGILFAKAQRAIRTVNTIRARGAA